MTRTKIPWATHSWNPVEGCSPVSEGCDFCYAREIATRFKGTEAYPNGFDVTLHPERLGDPATLKKPAIIFTVSMGDLFHKDVPSSAIYDVIAAIMDSPRHQFVILTKRPERAVKILGERIENIPLNLWLGVSAENQETLEQRWAALSPLRDYHSVISLEPLLEPMDLSKIKPKPSWIIAAGESGRHLFDPANAYERGLAIRSASKWKPLYSKLSWLRSIRDWCTKNQVPLFFKGWGGATQDSAGHLLDGRVHRNFPLEMREIAESWGLVK